MLRQTIEVMKKLRELNKFLKNSLRINEFVDTYINECMLNSEPVVFITPWSLSPRFKTRYIEQRNIFIPTQKEIDLFNKEIPNIVNLFKENGFTIEWWIIFSRAYLNVRLLEKNIENQYVDMIKNIIKRYDSPVVIINWEDDVINKRHTPNADLLIDKNFDELIDKENYFYELTRWTNWVQEENINITKEELATQTKYQIACEAEEGKFLMKNFNNPLCKPGNFLFVPLGNPERYIFFSTLVPEFKKRILNVLKLYPWRLEKTPAL
ncbi:MAG: hypothetical protein NT161_03275 [Candidatus Nomurabacteria bacterium]|nr:hypothetical protein [Candidatus Nomurabacteria bacterium]